MVRKLRIIFVMNIFTRKASLGPGPVFAVVDVETTGLNPSSSSIVEVGVSLLDRYFIEVGRWETLINPGKAVRGRVCFEFG